jgi:hypothetical protein
MAGSRGESYDEQLDRVRRLVNERRFALGVQLILKHRDPLDIMMGYAKSPRARSWRSPGDGARVRAMHGEVTAASC